MSKIRTMEWECRYKAKEAGLTFKRQINQQINIMPLYKFIDRKTKKEIINNCTIYQAYNKICNGYISTYNYKTQTFNYI